jgi:hypothetical protein
MIRSILAGVVGATMLFGGPQTPGLISIYADDPSFLSTGGADDYRLTVDDHARANCASRAGPQAVSASYCSTSVAARQGVDRRRGQARRQCDAEGR